MNHYALCLICYTEFHILNEALQYINSHYENTDTVEGSLPFTTENFVVEDVYLFLLQI